MVQKRYEHFKRKGKAFTEWYDTRINDSELATYQKEEKWQLYGKLRNEFRIKP